MIEEHWEIAPGEFHLEYRKRIVDPNTDRTIPIYLDKLEQYNLMSAEGIT